MKISQKTYLILVYALLYIPIIVLILYSFNQARFSLLWRGFSTHWYAELVRDRALWSTFAHSILLGLSAALIATCMGLFTCVQFFLKQKRHRFFDALILVLIILPDLVLGVALLIFFNLSGIALGFFSLLIAHITFCLPFAVLTIKSRLHHLDRNMYFSALDLGASHWTALRKIIFPLLSSTVLSAFLLSFTLSFDDVIISYFVSGPEFNILPLTIYALVRAGVTPELNALCSVTILISMVLVIFAHRMSRQNS